VLLSGGLDSTVALAQSLHRGHDCRALTYEYGQVHATREIEAAKAVAEHYGVQHEVLAFPAGLMGASALTGSGDLPDFTGAPDASVVPGRNLLMLAIGASRADATGHRLLVFGANADDAVGYADCRRAFVEPMRDAVHEGTTGGVWLHVPFLHLGKSEVVRIGRGLDAPIDATWSCYRGGEQPCGTCGACVTRGRAGA
jgi:7-cyano-7-deazaguanine synthase